MKRWLQLVVGLFGFGVAVPLMIRSGLGLGPWDAFHVGLHNVTGISVGTASILVGLLIVLGSIPLGVRAGPGTLANMVLIGVFIDVMLPVIPLAQGWAMGFVYYGVGIALAGICTGMYMAARLGNGPRDGLMIGVATVTDWPVRRVRAAIEMSALLGGWLMGGAIGVGTLLFALTIGPAVQIGLKMFGVLPPQRRLRIQLDPAAALASGSAGAPEAVDASSSPGELDATQQPYSDVSSSLPDQAMSSPNG